MPHRQGHVLTPEEQERFLESNRSLLRRLGLSEDLAETFGVIPFEEQLPALAPTPVPAPTPQVAPQPTEFQGSPFFQSRLSQQPSRKLQGSWEGIAQPIGGTIGFGIQAIPQAIGGIGKLLEAAESTTKIGRAHV